MNVILFKQFLQAYMCAWVDRLPAACRMVDGAVFVGPKPLKMAEEGTKREQEAPEKDPDSSV